MKISGFTFIRNASKLDFPFRESVLSILPLVDEYVIAYCEGDEDDNTLEIIESISSGKIKLVNGNWDPDNYYRNTLYAHLTDLAKMHCDADWLFYLQGDEVVHEDDLPIIKAACKFYYENQDVEGLLFDYKHFWGDYSHYYTHHGWYPREIRIIRNLDQIHSWRDAQSFRVIENFNDKAEDYLRKEQTRKLRVAKIPAHIFHYGWVRNPYKMQEKQIRMHDTLDPNHEEIKEKERDYGPMSLAHTFRESHPGVMKSRIESLNWQSSLYQKGKIKRKKYKHEMTKYRIRSWIEINLLGGREIGGFRNYILVDKFKN